MQRASMFASRVLRVPGSSRPAPSLFYYPGLTSQPFWSPSHAALQPWLSRLEEATPEITSEYMALRQANVPSDYEPEASEETQLHTGKEPWHWASLVDDLPHVDDRVQSLAATSQSWAIELAFSSQA